MRASVGALALAGLSGCASVRGSQERLTVRDVTAFTAVCPSEQQVTAAHANETDGAYRDRIIMVCVKAINAKYGAFAESLSAESTSVNLLTDIASLGASTAASVVSSAKTAQRLAAGSAFALGLNGVVSKDLFYKQTLPAIVASMDARRAKVLTGIVEAQNGDRDARTYTLVRAGADLDRYQEAGSLIAAVQELTSTAVQNAVTAEGDLQAAERDLGTFTEETPQTVIDRAIAATDVVRAFEAAKADATLRAVAQALGLSVAAGAPASVTGPLVRVEIADVTTIPLDQQEARMTTIEGILQPHLAAAR